jgi:hypothetical protein
MAQTLTERADKLIDKLQDLQTDVEDDGNSEAAFEAQVKRFEPSALLRSGAPLAVVPRRLNNVGAVPERARVFIPVQPRQRI